MPRRQRRLGRQNEPVKSVRRQRQQITQRADRREGEATQQIHRHPAAAVRNVQLHRLRRACQVIDAQNGLRLATIGRRVGAQIRQHLAVARPQEVLRATAESPVPLAHRQHPPGPVQQRVLVRRLRLHINRGETVDRVHHRRQHQIGRIGARKSAVAVRRPLHRRAHPVAVAQMDVVAHADLVAVIDHRRAGHRQQQPVHQLDPPPVMLHQRCQPPPDAEVDSGPPIGGVGVPQIISFRIRNHFQRQLVMVAQENRPLAVLRYFRRLPHDVGDRKAVFLRDRHIHARHQRKVKRHMALIAGAEILLGVLRPLVGLGQQHPPRRVVIERRADFLQNVVGLGEVLVVGAVALDQIRHRVQPQPIDAEVEPEAHHVQHLLQHPRIVEIQIRLMREKPVPVERLGGLVPGPVGFLGVDKDDACA